MILFDNTINISNIHNYTFDFKKLLTIKNTIHVKDCNNVNIFINSKINKIILENCTKINITMKRAIIGVEINKSSLININLKKNINCIECYKSVLFINKKSKKTKYINENSKIILIK